MSSSKVPDWLLERLAAGDLKKEKAEEVRKRLAETDEVARLSMLVGSNAEILADHPAEKAVAEIKRRAEAKGFKRSLPIARWSWGMAAASLACLGAFLVLRSPGPSPLDPMGGSETITLKGEARAQLRIYRKSEAGPELLTPKSTLHAGDNLQIRYLSSGRRFGVIASIDARGTVTLHLPERAGTAMPLGGEGEKALLHSYELDDSPGFERFLFLSADSPFPSSLAIDLLTRKKAVPAAMTAFEITFAKVTP